MQPQDPNEQNQNSNQGYQPAGQPQQPPAEPERVLPEPYPPQPQTNQPQQPYAQPAETPQYSQPQQPQRQYPAESPNPQGQQNDQAGPQQMYYSRPLEPQKPVMTPAIQQKCEESRAKYPKLNLSEGEYIVSDVKRHPIGMLQIWFFVAVIIAAIFGVLILLVSSSGSMTDSSSLPKAPIAVVAILLCVLTLIGGYIGAFVYKANRFYLTNESVIQNIQMSLFANREQTVSLGNVEDASYHKHGIIQTIFDFGTLRLSTQGDETTYRFSYASSPAKQVAKLNNAVEAFKNGRPVEDDDDG